MNRRPHTRITGKSEIAEPYTSDCSLYETPEKWYHPMEIILPGKKHETHIKSRRTQFY